MSTFFHARVLSVNHASANVFLETRKADLLRIATAAKIKGGASKLSRSDASEVLRAHLESLGQAAAASLIYASVFQRERLGEKRLLATIGTRLEDAKVVVDDCVPTSKPEVAWAIWFAQNLSHHFFPSAFVPIVRTECAVEVRETGDVRIPSEREVANAGSLAPQFASRLFRDAHRFLDATTEDASRNPWVAEFGWEKMAKPAWTGSPPLDAVVIERPERKTAIVRALSLQRWTAHLKLERVFASAG
jgi:hypothetical protein